MIASLRGQIQAVRADSLVIDVGGVGYQVFVPRSILDQPGHIGQTIELHTHLSVRETEVALYGFRAPEELELFSVLIGVSGIGPRTALAALSVFSPETLRGVVSQGDATALTRIPGVGRKTAQRLVLDLRDRLGEAETAWAPAASPADADVINALTALGYSVAEAQAAVGNLPAEVSELDERILAALRYLGSQ